MPGATVWSSAAPSPPNLEVTCRRVCRLVGRGEIRFGYAVLQVVRGMHERIAGKMTTPVNVEALSGYRVWIKFTDGTEGEIDLSDFAGKGVFEAWLDRTFFEAVEVAPYDAITWPGDLSLCSDMLYMRLTGKSLEDIFPDYSPVQTHV